eukprot:gnl/TRDRNA2_/TRDRNA2_130514_c0_seq1.p1 gnl/TRDRNA2_/TRDRNA2_130514_c0~~gnl/TRDRNA2_/TRDRNA2_130514_c0_seq1.p1  ORF type:complete len:386 (+),score=52.91 gnl/TRDRNA2_/TRDRNA2_130514_c0_seq1:84-1241(+)
MDPEHLGSLGLPLVSSFCSRMQRRAVVQEDAAVEPVLRVLSKAEALAESMRRPLVLRRPSREISIVSFNMLLKGFEDKPYYPSVPAELRAWPYRKGQLARLLFGLNVDVFLMQEVEIQTFANEFSFLCDGGYDFVEPRDDGKVKHPDMAKTAIFYKTERMEKLWEEHRSRIVLAAFRHRPSNQMLYVASCHLQGAPWEGAARFAQAKKALDSIQKQMLKNCKEQGTDPASCALVFAGDFNEVEDSAVSYCLRTGGLTRSFRNPGYPEDELTKADYKHEFKLSDLYASGGATGLPDRPATFCAPPEADSAWGLTPTFCAIDHVFYSHGALRPVAVRLPFTAEQVRATEGIGIPSEWHFSDHVPIGGIFEFVSGSDGAPQNSAVEMI